MQRNAEAGAAVIELAMRTSHRSPHAYSPVQPDANTPVFIHKSTCFVGISQVHKKLNSQMLKILSIINRNCYARYTLSDFCRSCTASDAIIASNGMPCAPTRIRKRTCCGALLLLLRGKRPEVRMIAARATPAGIARGSLPKSRTAHPIQTRKLDKALLRARSSNLARSHRRPTPRQGEAPTATARRGRRIDGPSALFTRPKRAVWTSAHLGT